MKFNPEEMKTINNFFNWIKKTLNNKERYKIGDSFIEDKKTGKITRIDIGYGMEMLDFAQKIYFMECYIKNHEN